MGGTDTVIVGDTEIVAGEGEAGGMRGALVASDRTCACERLQ
jgi:hypothetical protein